MTDEEKVELAKLNLQVGRKSKKSTAYESACGFLIQAVALIKVTACYVVVCACIYIYVLMFEHRIPRRAFF